MLMHAFIAHIRPTWLVIHFCTYYRTVLEYSHCFVYRRVSLRGNTMNIECNNTTATRSSAHACGVLYKWTNYVLGWQRRYFELEDGVFVYYKTQNEKQFGSRGSITVRCAIIAESDVDKCRFDVATNGLIWYLRAENITAKTMWINALNSYARDSGYCSPSDRISNASACSTSSLLKTSSTVLQDELRNKVEELEKYRELALRQVERIQRCINTISQYQLLPVEGDSILEEGIALSATTSAILSDISVCISLLNEQMSNDASHEEIAEVGVDSCNITPAETDVVDVPNAVADKVLSDDEQDWHDATDIYVETPSDAKLSDDISATNGTDESAERSVSPNGILSLPNCHSLSAEINRITMEQLRYAKASVEDQVWQLFSEEGDMKMYKREVEVDGLACDPLKATHAVQGVSAKEFIHFFFEPQYKSSWDETVEMVNVVETVSMDTLIIHQVHKRVWPSAQRESLFWSHVRQVNSHKDPDALDLFIVCNHDCERPDVPLENIGNVRVGLTIAMVCETIIKEGHTKPRHLLTRDDIFCRVIYVAQVHPGGWVPSSALRIIYKREYPKFLRGFTKYVVERIKSHKLSISTTSLAKIGAHDAYVRTS
uniref:Collagen type IV alpha-3-binding protein n=1 Tax=Parascaris univalens TaxID=6257 RepID=A0A915B551_PARUN